MEFPRPLREIGDSIGLWHVLKIFNSNPNNHTNGSKASVIIPSAFEIAKTGVKSYTISSVRNPASSCLISLNMQMKGERNQTSKNIGTKSPFKKMKPAPNKPNKVLVK